MKVYQNYEFEMQNCSFNRTNTQTKLEDAPNAATGTLTERKQYNFIILSIIVHIIIRALSIGFSFTPQIAVKEQTATSSSILSS